MNNKGNVIIVDDDEDDRELLADVFKNLNLDNEILFFSNGKAAFDYLSAAANVPFLILSDVHMPGLSGPELCEKIRAAGKPELTHIPFVYFTTSTTRIAISEAYLAGADGFFIKPSSISELQTRIGHIIAYWQHCQLPSDYF